MTPEQYRERIQEQSRYSNVVMRLLLLDGQRVRLTYRHNDAVCVTGFVSTRDFGHCIDVMLDNRGGRQYADVTRIERMGEAGRYETVWEAS